MSRLLATLIVAILLSLPTPALAQAVRTWVSGVGDDANPCSRTAPCKTFAGAISKTATNGEINVLDSGGFGAVNITKSITIDGQGALASILASGTNGVIINGAGIVVTLRNLTINGANSTVGNGIRIINASAVVLDNVTIENFGGASPSNGRGIVIETSANIRVSVLNSRLSNLNFIGIHSTPTAGNVTLDVDNSTVTRGGSTAIQLRQNTTGTISRSSLTNNGGAGVSTELSTVTAMISNSILANNVFGVFNGNGGNPTTRLFANTITGNTTDGLRIVTGSVFSHGNNAIRGNTGNETPTQVINTQ
jgi:hypothetical protein